MTVRAVNESCPRCHAPGQLLYYYEPTDPSLGLACPECVRSRARTVNRTTPCDKCSAPGAWRNPYTRKNEYLCGTCHAASGDGVVLNKWYPRVSQPHPLGRRALCSERTSVTECAGEVKPFNVGGVTRVLCRKHAGRKTSASDV